MGLTTDEYIQSLTDEGWNPSDAANATDAYISGNHFGEDFKDFANENFGPKGMDLDTLISEDTSVIVGCSFGLNNITSLDNDFIYVPSSYHCLFKSLEVCMKLLFKSLISKEFQIIRLGAKPYGTSIKLAHERLKNAVNNEQSLINLTKNIGGIERFYKILPSIYCIHRVKGEIVCNRIKGKRYQECDKIDPVIVLLPFASYGYHAVVLKKGDNIFKMNARELHRKIISYVKFEKDTELVNEWKKIREVHEPKFTDNIVVYDIETYVDGPLENQTLLPYALGFSYVDLKEKTVSKPRIIELSNEYPNIYDKFFDILSKENIGKLQAFAHNGSRFDTIYAKTAKNVVWKSQIKVGSQLKSLTGIIGSLQVELKDTCLFTQSSLKDACNQFKTPVKKMEEFDIKGWSKERYQTEREWYEYLELDVESLGWVAINLEASMREFGTSITTNLGLASAAWKIMNKTCIGMSELYVPRHPSMIEFCRGAVYGGRVVHWKKQITEDLISNDYNSLYPSAMHIGEYPIGRPNIIPSFEGWKVENRTIITPPVYACYIVEVEIEMPNLRYQIHPYRNENGGIEYRNGVIVGTYDSVLLNEIVKDGGKVRKWIRGIYWSRKARIFPIIEKLYKERARVGGDTSMGYFLKILLNSMYGKMLEIISSRSGFSQPEDSYRSITLPNGQLEYSYSDRNVEVTKPLYIAVFILSYSKLLVNEMIRKVRPENIYYSDTDSIYMPDRLQPLVESYMNKSLCGFKNDYGDGTVINGGRFIDLKRYLLKFNNGKSKIKYIGIDFKHGNLLQNFYTSEKGGVDADKLFDDIIYMSKIGREGLYGVNLVSSKWIKSSTGVSIKHTPIDYKINPSMKGDWVNDEFYSLGYDHNKKEDVLPLSEIGDYEKSHRDIKMKTMRIIEKPNLLWVSMKELHYYKTKTKFNFIENAKIGSDIVEHEGVKYYYDRYHNKFFVFTKYGIGEQIDIEPNNTTVFLLTDNDPLLTPANEGLLRYFFIAKKKI